MYHVLRRFFFYNASYFIQSPQQRFRRLRVSNERDTRTPPVRSSIPNADHAGVRSIGLLTLDPGGDVEHVGVHVVLGGAFELLCNGYVLRARDGRDVRIEVRTAFDATGFVKFRQSTARVQQNVMVVEVAQRMAVARCDNFFADADDQVVIVAVVGAVVG